VSKFEFNLLRILRFYLGHFPADQGMHLLSATLPRPDCLSTDSVHLIKDTLSKACVLHLVRDGGWRNDRYLRASKPSGGRVWDRIPLDERSLEFSHHVMDFLIWSTAEKVHEPRTSWDVKLDELTPADEYFFWRVFDSCRSSTELLDVFRRKVAFKRNPLCWLFCPGDVAESDEPAPPDFHPMFTGVRAVILECLQSQLASRWIRSERSKGQLGDWKRMRNQGRAEFVALQAFLAAAEDTNRLDLAQFVLQTNAVLFWSDLGPLFWTGGLQGSGPPRLADRLETHRAALALPRQMEVLEGWQQRALSVGYFDDDYQASQLWKQLWEAANGDAVTTRARNAVALIEPLRAQSPRQPATGDMIDNENPEGTPR